MNNTVPGTQFYFALKNRAPFFSAVGCERWDCEGGLRFFFANCLYQGLNFRGC